MSAYRRQYFQRWLSKNLPTVVLLYQSSTDSRIFPAIKRTASNASTPKPITNNHAAPFSNIINIRLRYTAPAQIADPMMYPKSYHPPLFGYAYIRISLSNTCPTRASGAVSPFQAPEKNPGGSYASDSGCEAQLPTMTAMSETRRMRLARGVTTAETSPIPVNSITGGILTESDQTPNKERAVPGFPETTRWGDSPFHHPASGHGVARVPRPSHGSGVTEAERAAALSTTTRPGLGRLHHTTTASVRIARVIRPLGAIGCNDIPRSAWGWQEEMVESTGVEPVPYRLIGGRATLTPRPLSLVLVSVNKILDDSPSRFPGLNHRANLTESQPTRASDALFRRAPRLDAPMVATRPSAVQGMAGRSIPTDSGDGPVLVGNDEAVACGQIRHGGQRTGGLLVREPVAAGPDQQQLNPQCAPFGPLGNRHWCFQNSNTSRRQVSTTLGHSSSRHKYARTKMPKKAPSPAKWKKSDSPEQTAAKVTARFRNVRMSATVGRNICPARGIPV